MERLSEASRSRESTLDLEAHRSRAREGRGVKRIRVAVVTNVLPHYRSAFYERLVRRSELELRVFCQTSIPGMNLKLVHGDFPDHVTVVSAACMKQERLCWQWLPWRSLLTSFDVLFVLGNPRVVSGVLLATLGRAIGKRVVLWGQAHTANAQAKTERLRLWWWRWFDHLFVYTEGEARWLKSQGFRRQDIVGMNNGLDQRRIDAAIDRWDAERLAAWRQKEGLVGKALVLSCARLEPKNQFELWLNAMPAVTARYPDLIWCVVGDGRERQALEAASRRNGVEPHVRWLGEVLEEDELAPWFLTSRLLVHPAAIGLTLLHAFGYGLPVVTHDDRSGQMPEFDAFVPGETGLLYRRGDVADLAETVCRGLGNEAGRRHMGQRAQQVAREQYNVDVMVERFVGLAKRAAGREDRPYPATG